MTHIRPHVTWFILLATILFFSMGNPDALKLWPWGSAEFRWWQPVTYTLTHANALHLAINMLALLSFGPALERAWGKWRFAACYVICGALGGLTQATLVDAPIVGASGALFGLFAAFTMGNPHRRILSLVPYPLPAWVVLAGYVGVSALAWAFHWFVGLAHAAHVGGALAGVLCALSLRNR